MPYLNSLISTARMIVRNMLVLLLLPLSLLISGCKKDEPDQPKQTRRTVLIYMVAQNSLGKYGFCASDSIEIMEGRQYISDNDCLLMYIDNLTNPCLYQVTRKDKTPKLIKQWDRDLCSSNPENLEETLRYVKSLYPSDEYGLVMWSHSDGWVPPTNTNYETTKGKVGEKAQAAMPVFRPFSFGIDNGNTGGSDKGPQMDIVEMADAIARAGWHCRYIFFDSCMMQNLEVDYALRRVTDYVIASPIAISAYGGYYTHLLADGLFAANPADIVGTYVNDVSADVRNDYRGYGIVHSCVETACLPDLAEAIRLALPYSRLAEKTSVSMENVLGYVPFDWTTGYHPENYDALQALRAIIPMPYLPAIETALGNAIKAYGATSSFCKSDRFNTYQPMPSDKTAYCGVSMFIPHEEYDRRASSCKFGNLNEAFRQTEWYRACGFENTGW